MIMVAASQLKITPLGGLGQIGSNMISVELKTTRILIDSGLLFPYESCFDLNYLIPDFYHINKPEALIITHGHEDHIGAIVHVLKHFPDIPVYAPPFATALIRKKLELSKIHFTIKSYEKNDSLQFGELTIYPIHVNHSIPQTYGLLIKALKDTVFYVSDFKIDKHSPYEDAFDFNKIESLIQNSQRRILMADSTNICSKNLKTPGEGSLIPHLEKLMNSHFQRVFVTTFSSNVHRIQTILNTSHSSKRKVVPYGRSVCSYSQIAEELGLLKNWSSSIHDIEEVDLEKSRLTILISGCQGDFRSALRRVATGTDTHFKPRKNDLFIFSSKAIPGNEKTISLLINELIRAGATVITEADKPVHVSGHPGKLDLLELYQVMKPDILVPIHGEVQFLYKHAHYFLEKFPDKEVRILLNHQSLILNDKVDLYQNEEKPPLLIHGLGIEIERDRISQRRKCATTGALFFSLNKGDITLTPLGLPKSFTESHLKKIKDLSKRQLGKKNKKSRKDQSEVIRVDIRRYCQTHLGYKPVVIVHL